jgi:MFS family permease
MFFAALVSAGLSYLVLRGTEESPMWQAAGREMTRTRLADLVRGGRGRAFALNVALVAGAGSQYYLTSGYLPTLLEKVVGVGDGTAGTILLVSSAGILVAVLGGELSEHVGRRRAMLLFGCVNIIALPLLAWLITHTAAGATGRIMAYSVALAMFANLSYTPVIAYLNECYPTRLRSRGTAVCWNTGFMIGGLMPTFLSLASPRLSAVPGRLVGFLLVAVAVYLVATALSPETRGAMESSLETEPLAEPADA